MGKINHHQATFKHKEAQTMSTTLGMCMCVAHWPFLTLKAAVFSPVSRVPYLSRSPWIFLGAPLNIKGAPGNIQGNLRALRTKTAATRQITTQAALSRVWGSEIGPAFHSFMILVKFLTSANQIMWHIRNPSVTMVHVSGFSVRSLRALWNQSLTPWNNDQHCSCNIHNFPNWMASVYL